MKAVWTMVLGAALLVGASAQAGTSPDLLSQVTAGAAAAEPLSLAELSDIRGEGTITKFIELPNLQRSFERGHTLDNGVSVSIVAVAGQGITITITNPHIPD